MSTSSNAEQRPGSLRQWQAENRKASMPVGAYTVRHAFPADIARIKDDIAKLETARDSCIEGP
jgi:hypothetical protein